MKKSQVKCGLENSTGKCHDGFPITFTRALKTVIQSCEEEFSPTDEILIYCSDLFLHL